MLVTTGFSGGLGFARGRYTPSRSPRGVLMPSFPFVSFPGLRKRATACRFIAPKHWPPGLRKPGPGTAGPKRYPRRYRGTHHRAIPTDRPTGRGDISRESSELCFGFSSIRNGHWGAPPKLKGTSERRTVVLVLLLS